MIKLIASDMDGTLLNSDHNIPNDNVELINYAQENGIKFVVATGRAYYEALPPLNEKNIKCDVISFNGGIVYDKNGHIISMTPMKPKDLYYTIEVFKSLEISYQLYTKNTVYTNSIDTDINAYADLIRAAGEEPNVEHLKRDAQRRLEAGFITEVDNIDIYLNQKENPSIKIIGISRNLEKLQKAQQLLASNENISVTSSGLNNIEVMDKHATKGNALAQIADIYSISLEEALAIGDNRNDEAMIDIVKYSIAMKNGVSELKDKAKFTTEHTNEEAGVAKAIMPLLKLEQDELLKKADDINKKLVEEAIKASNFAYVPYSNFKVGAALLTEDGHIYTGCNIENASFTPTNCAERTAIFKAVSEGKTKFTKIAVVGGPNGKLENYCPPCGVCRQVISEFADENFELILGKANGDYKIYNFFKEVLPLSFTSKDLEK